VELVRWLRALRKWKAGLFNTMVVTGIYYALALVAAAVAVSFLFRPAAAIPFYVLAAFCLYFFRDPDRHIADGPVAVAPADGKVVAIRPEAGGRTRISIFLSISAFLTSTLTAHPSPGALPMFSTSEASF